MMRMRPRCRPRSRVGEGRRRKQQCTRKTVRGRRTPVTQSLRLLRKIVRTTLIQKLPQRKRLRRQKKKSSAKPGKRGRGRPPGPAAAKKKESSPIYYEYDLSDTSFESEEASDDSEDSNYRPVGNNTRVKK